MNKKFLRPLKGFTLIELMVAIAIVAILATVGFTILQTAQASSRDSKRRSDIDAISQALELHWNSTTSSYDQILASWFENGAIPADPLGSGIYTYAQYGTYATNVSAVSTAYILCAKLEKAGGNSSTGNVITSASGAAGTFYCKKNQQQ